ncbi:MAG: hypothetical protein JRG94_17995 [Deltaproteobacteria bacterium]|nr:hypothetical protein [Deltaproteobacteria bacterium]
MVPAAFLDKLRSPPILIGLALTLLAGGYISADRSGEAVARDLATAQSDPTRAALGTADRTQNAYDGGLGFVVPYRPDCPRDTERRGAEPPEGFEEWCARVGRDAGIKHGWYSRWYPSGRPENAGAYEDGLRIGVWTRWYPSGKKRVQAEFRRGLQHGKLMSWDEEGKQLGEQLFKDGSLVDGGR